MVSESDTAVSLPVLGNLTYREIHAVEDGLYCGYVGKDTEEYESDYEQEKHYWRMGYLAGDIVLSRLK
jgi:hypothetical protein